MPGKPTNVPGRRVVRGTCEQRYSGSAAFAQPRCGAHAFRRFRLTWLRKNDVPKDLERFWMGHEDEEIGDRYSKLKQDVEFRQAVAKKIDLCFELPAKNHVIGPNGPKIEFQSVQEMSASARFKRNKWRARRESNP